MWTRQCLEGVLAWWKLEVSELHPEISVVGSPNRCLNRLVVEDDQKRLFVVEQIHQEQAARRQRIARIISWFANRGMESIVPFLCTDENRFVVPSQGAFWMVSPYVEGIDLDRPEYVKDMWRGREAARVICDIHRLGGGIPWKCEPFSITRYVMRMHHDLLQCNPEVLFGLRPVFEWLRQSRFFSVCDCLPRAFCHGDLHPLNMIWGKDNIIGIIDWEFCGVKQELYDVANLVGCVGVEDPESLKGGFAAESIRCLIDSQLFSEESWARFLELMVAVRFGWLAEWLRNEDGEMIELESQYMRFLVEESKCLQRDWNLPVSVAII